LNSAHYYRLLAEKAWPHTDGTSRTDSRINQFNWRDRPHYGNQYAELGSHGGPSIAQDGFPSAGWITNGSQSFLNWGIADSNHFHWYGLPTYYFMTGDETMREAMLPLKDYYLNPDTQQGGNGNGGLVISRDLGIAMMGSARFYELLQGIGDADANSVLAMGQSNYANKVKTDPCVSGYPAGCSDLSTTGISRVRGIYIGNGGIGWCPYLTGPYNRMAQPFENSILIEGMLELRRLSGPGWGEYKSSLDLAYGLSQWSLIEGYNDNGTTSLQGSCDANGYCLYNGFRYMVQADVANICPSSTALQAGLTQIGGNIYDGYTLTSPLQGTWMNFYAQYLATGKTDWLRKFKLAMSQVAYHQAGWPSDFGSYQIGTLIDAINHPTTAVLNDVAFSVQDGGSGNYTLTWTVPAGVNGYRIKWSPKTIAPSAGLLNFDNLSSNSFGLSPATYSTWFAANNVNEPIPATAGTVQSIIISTGTAGLTAANFSVKSYGGVGVVTGPPANLLIISGAGQSGTVGQALGSAFTVKVTDAGGNPVSGVAVVFAVTGGGGTLSATSTVTDSLGQAYSTLTLGPSSGVNTVTATSGTLAGSPVTFTATGTTVSATTITMISGNGQTGATGQALASAFTVKVTSTSGAPVSGVAVTFAVTGGQGTLSATNTVTDSLGQAYSTLTLGPSAAVNTVMATSGTLAGSPVTFTATATATVLPALSWTIQTPGSVWPSSNAYLSIHYDPVSQQTFFYVAGQGTSTIYSSDVYFFNSSNNAFTRLGGNGTGVLSYDNYASDATVDTATWPGDRHPYAQMAVDTKRNVLWLYGGVSGGNIRADMYYLTLNADITQDKWNRVTTAHFPGSGVESGMVYDPDDDVLFVYGYDGGAGNHNNWVYCRTVENPTPGTPTAAQRAAGCVNPDDWSEVTVAGGAQPPGWSAVGMVYDTLNKKIIHYGGVNSYGPQNQTWAYDVPTKTWTRKCSGTCTPPPLSGDDEPYPAMAYNSNTHKLIYHLTTGAGAPSDWQYDLAADIWAPLPSSGTGAKVKQALAYDAKNNLVIGWNEGYSPDLWLGTLGSSSPSPCDLNRDGRVNVLDVQLAVLQTSGTCTTADLNGDGVCDSVDVKRFVTAALNGTCQTGR
jgi:hypothetical protein